MFGRGDGVPISSDGLVCAKRCIRVFVVKGSYEPPKLGGISLVCVRYDGGYI